MSLICSNCGYPCSMEDKSCLDCGAALTAVSEQDDFNRLKALRAAEKHLARSNFKAAIQELRKVVTHAPEDFASLRMLGDMYARAGEKQEAAVCFMRAARHYDEEGETAKALLLYKKLSNLNPNHNDIDLLDKIALLYARLERELDEKRANKSK